MFYQDEQARTQRINACSKIRKEFKRLGDLGIVDAVYRTASRQDAVGFSDLPYEAPICTYLLNQKDVAAFLEKQTGSILIQYQKHKIYFMNRQGMLKEDNAAERGALEVYHKVLASAGTLNEEGELVLDLKAYPVGPHYPVNLLLGNRAGYPYPLCTTPKSALDSLGRGSFRATGGEQVLATRCVLELEENGEPANRQFYLTENGKQIFYSANVNENVASAECVHSQNRTLITYMTKCGLEIKRTIFILPQQKDMPNAVEAQRVEIVNHSSHERHLRIVMTGVFGITGPMTIANDCVFANIVNESEVFYDGSRPVAMTLFSQPKDEQCKKRFAALLCGGHTMDEFCTSQSMFIGRGTLDHPELAGHLPNEYSRKMTPFFAMAKQFTVKPEKKIDVDEFVGMLETEGDAREPFDAALHTLIEKYRHPAELAKTFREVTDFWSQYPQYLVPGNEDECFRSYVSHNLPFQVLYQTYVSRAFAWTQKSYRETGFREIQDIYASMYYLNAIGEKELIRELLSSWVRQVYRMGYANHDFTFQGKEPGDCSDDQLWLVQAVYRYVTLTGDTEFLTHCYPIAGEDEERPLWETLMSILTYSGSISVGAHGLPLLDKADWNDTLRLDPAVMKGPQKEEAYLRQLKEKNQKYGVPFENTLCESVMNACLLKIAADETAEMAALINEDADGRRAAELSEKISDSVQKNAWKEDFFARCLINDGRKGGYTYLGSTGDGLSLDPKINGSYFLNSYSWPILAGIADEAEISKMLEVVTKYLRTDAGLKLCTLVDFDRLGTETGTSLYFPGDRENGGVFKHAAMMATVASLQAAKKVKDQSLSKKLLETAFFMISRTVPYASMDRPFTLKGNPRFCTQYNNSETGENIGPMLSGTASWLTLAVYEYFGVNVSQRKMKLEPVLRPGMESMSYQIHIGKTELDVKVIGGQDKFRTGSTTKYEMDGRKIESTFQYPSSGKHQIVIHL
jgi:Cellobiose phosphorylase